MSHVTASTGSGQAIESFAFPSVHPQVRDPLTEVLRCGARDLLMAAVEQEVGGWIDEHALLVDEAGRRQVVRNGHADPRKIITGLGPLEVRMPRVHDRRPPEDGERFTSKILPPYLRKAKSIEQLIPWLYLKGISTGDFSEALSVLVGPECPGFSATTVTRLLERWQEDFREWNQRDLSGKPYVYVWADGIYFNVRLEEDRVCILVLIGATADGRKQLIAVADGFRESEQSWTAMLLELKQRGLSMDPKLAAADGAFDLFIATYQAKYPQAVECLAKDREALLSFYDFPAEHWIHLRTTNVIESPFATVRLRHDKTKGNGSRRACLAMVFKLAECAGRRWKRLHGYELIPDVIAGVTFTDGVKQQAA